MKILVPVDGSLSAHNAAKEAIKYAKKDNASIKLVTVVDISTLSLASEDIYGPIISQMTESGNKLLESMVQDLDFSGVQVEKEVRNGRAYEQILEAAKEDKVDMIVMGNRGFSKIRRFFVGSVAQRVISEAPCPVMVIHTDAEN